jgi:hypothetical protein
MFIKRRVDRREIPEGSHVEPTDLYNKMNAGHRVKVEWAKGGLKRKWRRFMKRFDSTKPRFTHLFHAGCINTNLLRRRRMDMNFGVTGMQQQMAQDIRWDGDY